MLAVAGNPKEKPAPLPDTPLAAGLRYGAPRYSHADALADLERKQASADRLAKSRRGPDAQVPRPKPTKEQRELLKRLKLAGVDMDTRTAQALRDIGTAGVGKAQFASIQGFADAYRKPGERHPWRAQTWTEFDEICHERFRGEYVECRFEPSVDNSSIPNVPDARLTAERRLRRVREAVGARAFGVLVGRIYLNQSFRQLAAEGHCFGNEDLVAGTFKLALDDCADLWSLRPKK